MHEIKSVILIKSIICNNSFFRVFFPDFNDSYEGTIMFIWYLYSVWWPQFQTRNWVFDLLHCTALLGGVQISLGVVWRPLFFLLYNGCKLCNFWHSSKQLLLKNSSQWICCRYAWWYTRCQSFNKFFPSVFMEKYHVFVKLKREWTFPLKI